MPVDKASPALIMGPDVPDAIPVYAFGFDRGACGGINKNLQVSLKVLRRSSTKDCEIRHQVPCQIPLHVLWYSVKAGREILQEEVPVLKWNELFSSRAFIGHGGLDLLLLFWKSDGLPLGYLLWRHDTCGYIPRAGLAQCLRGESMEVWWRVYILAHRRTRRNGVGAPP